MFCGKCEHFTLRYLLFFLLENSLKSHAPDSGYNYLYAVRKVLAEFAVQYMTDDAIAKLYVT